jgi:hypothetical protein
MLGIAVRKPVQPVHWLLATVVRADENFDIERAWPPPHNNAQNT